MSRTLAWDFDATIHPYTQGWQGSVPVDEPPIPGAKETLQWAKRERFKNVIFSTRAREVEGLEGINLWLVKYELDQYIDDITFTKPPAIAYIDDRAVPFHGNWDDVVGGVIALAEGRHGGKPKT